MVKNIFKAILIFILFFASISAVVILVSEDIEHGLMFWCKIIGWTIIPYLLICLVANMDIEISRGDDVDEKDLQDL